MSGRRTNRDILSGGKKYIQKSAKKHGVEEVVFDKDSRQDYLTGFHKRKVQRQKKAQEYIKEQERLTRIEERKAMRDERKRTMEEQLQSFNESMKEINMLDSSSDDDDNWNGFENDEDADHNSESDEEEKQQQEDNEKVHKGILRRKEVYKIEDPTQFANTDAIIDEDTTVVVESVENPLMANIQQFSLEAKAKANCVDLSRADKVLENSIKRAQNYAVTAGVAKPSKKDKIKRKKFRYLTKTERKDNNAKQKLKKLKSRKNSAK